jgi:phosphoribosylanthranilate isomerase
MTKVKICGITNLQDAQNAVKAGADALGFVFYRKSPRYVAPKEAAAIIARLPKWIEKVGVFCNARERTIKRIIKSCGLTMVQLHGRESCVFCRRFADLPVIKAFTVKNKIDIRAIKRYNTYAYLFDTYHRGVPGGTGSVFDWSLIDPVQMRTVVFLAGGLHPGNVADAIAGVHPDWVDASSLLELSPGKKDARRVIEFIAVAKNQKPG